ncbi:MAG: hypothetical protein NTZ32_25895 [Planctomycetales bacterium]|nr:hypothetical protein [Planctomycetales bacterium]
MTRGHSVGLLLCAAWLVSDLTPSHGQAYFSDRYSAQPSVPQYDAQVFSGPASVSSRMNDGAARSPYGDYRLAPAGHSLTSGYGITNSACEQSCPDGGDPGPEPGGPPPGDFGLPRMGCLNADCGPSRLTFRKGMVFLHRSRPDSQAFTDGATPTNAHDFDPGFQSGPQGDLTWRNLNRSNVDLQGLFFHVSGFSGETVTLAASQLLTTPPINFPVMDVTNFFNSSMSSGELNLRREWSPWFTVIGGVRYFDLQEQLFHKICDTGMTERIRASNHAYGFQSGAEAVFFRSCRLEFGGWAKYAVLNNFVEQQTVTTLIPGVLPSFADSGSQIAFLGDVGLSATLRITCWLSVRGGYQSMWFNGAATAAPQMLTSNVVTGVGSVAADSNLFFHGGFANFEINW